MGALTHNGEVLQRLPADASQINFDKTGTNLNSTQTENAIKEVNTKANTLQTEKADTDIVAADFNAGTSYTAGNYCIYEGKFYKFKASHTGAWSAADVDEIKIAGELSALKSGLIDVNSKISDIDSFTFTAASGYASSNLTAQKVGRLHILSVQVAGAYSEDVLVTIGTVSERPNTVTNYFVSCSISDALGSPLGSAVAFIDANGDVRVAPAVNGGYCTIFAVWFA